MAGWDFIMNGQDFIKTVEMYYDSSRFSPWQVEILFWTVEIFMMTGREFHDDSLRFYYEQWRF